LLLMKSLFTWTHIYPADGYVPLQWQELHDLLILYQQRHRPRVMKFLLYIFCSSHYSVYNVFINSLHLFMFNSLTYISMLTIRPTSLLLCIIFFHCFPLLSPFYCCHHVTSTLYCCVISVTVIHSYKILLFLLYLACCSCVYVCVYVCKLQ